MGCGCIRLLLVIFILIGLVLQPIDGAAKNLPRDLNPMIGKQDSLLVTEPNGRILYAKNADVLLTPASTLKILTALTAFHVLGPEHRFVTEFYLDGEANLIIKGYGDPLLISEVMAAAAAEIAKRTGRIRDIILDPSYFSDGIVIPGAEINSVQPYDAPVGGLCANFNSVAFQKDPATGRFVSTEPQTPLLPFVLPRIKASGLTSGRIILFNEQDETLLYAGHLFDYFFNEAGISTSHVIRRGRLENHSARLLYRLVSPYTLDEVVSKLLFFSTNFIANQVFIAAGAKQFGPPGNLDKGVHSATDYAKRILGIKGLHIEEGSGLSHGNLVSARMLEKMLAAFEPHRHLMRKEDGQYYKTGTLNGVQTRAGYFENKAGRRFRFVLMVNTPGRGVVPVMKRVFRLLND